MKGEDAELAGYMRSLLEHARECEVEACPSCQRLHAIFELIRNRLFNSPIYPDVMLAADSSTKGKLNSTSEVIKQHDSKSFENGSRQYSTRLINQRNGRET